MTTVVDGQGGNQGQQGGAQPWFSGFDDDLKGVVTSKGWDKLPADQALPEILKYGRGAEKLLGVPADQVLKLPGKDAKPEDWKPVWQKLGAPEKPEDYGLQAPEGDSGEFLKTAVSWFHELGIPKAQAAGLAGKWNEYVQAAQVAEDGKWNQRFDSELNELKGEWKGDEYDKNVDLAKRVMRAAGWAPEQLTAMERALGPKAFLQGFAKFGSMVGEHRFVGGEQQQGFGMTPESAKGRIEALSKDSAWMTAYTGGDADKIAEWTRLHQIAYGTELANAA